MKILTKRIGVKWLSVLLAAVFAVFVLPFIARGENMLTITSATVNVRTGPGTGYDRIGSVSRGEEYRVVRFSGGWYQIDFPSQGQSGKGWVTGDYVSPFSTDILPISVRAGESDVNVRSGPGTNYDKVGSISVGTSYSVMSESGDWYRISRNGDTVGYVAKWLLTATLPPKKNPFDDTDLLKKAVIGAERANLRDSAEMTSRLLGTLTSGTRVAVDERINDWYRVIAETGQQGWVAAPYITFNDVSIDTAFTSQIPALERSVDAPMQGFATVSVEDQSYGICIAIVSDIPVVYTITKGAAGISIKTDLNLTGDSGTVNGISVSLAGAGELNISGADSLNYSAEQSADEKSLVVMIGNSPILGKTIYLDSGHAAFNSYGALDPGAIGPSGLYESDVALDITLKLKDELAALGAKAYMTHTGETTLSRFERTALANEIGADAFICIHCNASTVSSLKGSMVYTYAPASVNGFDRRARIALSEAILAQMVSHAGRRDLGVREDNFDVLLNTYMPAVLVETAFLSNPEEEKLLSTAAFRQTMAEAICGGIVDYFD